MLVTQHASLCRKELKWCRETHVSVEACWTLSGPWLTANRYQQQLQPVVQGCIEAGESVCKKVLMLVTEHEALGWRPADGPYATLSSYNLLFSKQQTNYTTVRQYQTHRAPLRSRPGMLTCTCRL